MPFAGHATGDGVACQANIMASESVWPAMLEAFNAVDGDLTTRLLSALDAAEAEGGDLRGRQSAAILVVPAEGEPWRHLVSLRVEDNPDPLVELRRLVRLHQAYTLAAQADDRVNEGRHDEAGELYQRASELVPDSHELLFWAGLGAARSGDLDKGLAKVRAAIARRPEWRGFLDRLSPSTFPAAVSVRERLEAAHE